ncbi:hypothetical protein [Methylomonas koyamae]|uniref:hypothetical protein n=1 Tax=Methylomonas koyamae TaxID=702114 RepID=UPI000A44E602|nr:hypothetical protein [Methylomonas koyamae]
MLTESGLLAQDHRLANAAQLTGAVLMITALLYCGRVLWEQRRGLNRPQQE